MEEEQSAGNNVGLTGWIVEGIEIQQQQLRILDEIARDWRELIAGSEGYLTSPSRRSLHRWPVAWGEQDSMVRLHTWPLQGCGKEERCVDSGS